MADQRSPTERRGHRLQSLEVGDIEDDRGTVESRQEIGCCGMARSSTENKTRTTMFVVVVLGLCSFFYLLGAWQARRFGGDCIAAMVNEQTKCVVLRNLHVETHLVLGDTPSWR